MAAARCFGGLVAGWIFCAGLCLATDKLDEPSGDDQAAAKRTIAELYKDEYDRAKTPSARSTLAKKLVQVGVDTKDDPAAQFVLWRIAKDVAVRTADYDLAATAIGKMNDRFTVDALAMKLQALESVIAAPEAVPDYKKLSPAANSLLDQAISDERFDLADRACAKTVEFARKLDTPSLVSQSKRRADELQKMETAYKDLAARLNRCNPTLRTPLPTLRLDSFAAS